MFIVFLTVSLTLVCGYIVVDMYLNPSDSIVDFLRSLIGKKVRLGAKKNGDG